MSPFEYIFLQSEFQNPLVSPVEEKPIFYCCILLVAVAVLSQRYVVCCHFICLMSVCHCFKAACQNLSLLALINGQRQRKAVGNHALIQHPIQGERMAKWLECWTTNSEAPSLSLTLTASCICSWYSRVQILDHACK